MAVFPLRDHIWVALVSQAVNTPGGVRTTPRLQRGCPHSQHRCGRTRSPPMSNCAKNAPSPTVPVRDQVMACLFQHRALTTDQLHRMLRPTPHPEYVRAILRTLRAAGLAESVRRRYEPSVWALSAEGRRDVVTWPQFRGRRPYRSALAGTRKVHTLTVTRTALAFLDDAQARGDEFRPLDWTVEVAHPLRDGAVDGERMLIADALMRYTRTAPKRALLRAFVEVDRATESSERLASKLISYARFHSAVPATPGRRAAVDQAGLASWQRSYTVFPRLLFVLTGAGERALAQRVADLRAMLQEHPLTERFANEVPTGAAVLEELEEHGASAAVWAPLDGRTGRCNWMDL
ncbi:replication-relaxation family protein [Streptomyces sp. NPDC050161]|uniref:replication-relaxation family protein n=1 Tax=Streptomyces sp. NPDC050161 TaxID=3365604 RepID=UPI0037A1E32C